MIRGYSSQGVAGATAYALGIGATLRFDPGTRHSEQIRKQLGGMGGLSALVFLGFPVKQWQASCHGTPVFQRVATAPHA